jgi:hypothetical protein
VQLALSRPRKGRGWTRGGFLVRCALAAALAALSGCSGFEKPRYEVGDRKLLLIPFRDFKARYQTGYGESPRGSRVLEEFRNYTEKTFILNLCEGKDAQNLLRSLQEWPKEKVTASDWRKLLAGVDTDLVLIGTIRDIQYQDPKTVGMWKGTIKGNYSLINAKTGGVAYKSTELALEYPKMTELDLPIPEFGAKQDDIERGLLKEFGERIGRDLFGYYPKH